MNDNEFYRGARVAVTGAAGTIGRALVDKLLALGVDEVRALDNNEGELFLCAEMRRKDPRFRPFVVDVRDGESLTRLFRGMQYAFHSAALKHVQMCETSPFSAVATNVNGVENVIRAGLSGAVKRVLFASSDKAVNPTNVMGSSKLLGERLFSAAMALGRLDGGTIFASTRFGNVAGSRGSVFPVFTQQIARGGPLTLTDRRMTRFVMTLDQATAMLLKCLTRANGGEVFITKMPALRVADLAEVMVEKLAPFFGHDPGRIEIVEVGTQPGEKLYEELASHEEIRRTTDNGGLLVVTPPFVAPLPEQPVSGVRNSAEETPMTKDEIAQFLTAPDVLPDNLRDHLLKGAHSGHVPGGSSIRKQADDRPSRRRANSN
jgi:FlaA1/EpsC-like NDP-sugar epimerase